MSQGRNCGAPIEVRTHYSVVIDREKFANDYIDVLYIYLMEDRMKAVYNRELNKWPALKNTSTLPTITDI